MKHLPKWLDIPVWAVVFTILHILKLTAFVLSIPARIVGVIAKQVGRLLDALSIAG